MASHRIVVFLSPAMISTKRGTTYCFVRTTLLVVIACLCFSVGEGLRLTPFPVSDRAESEATSIQFDPTVSYETSLYKYGPLDVPTRVQKRGKRQVVDSWNALSQNSRELTVQQVLLSTAGEPVDIVSLRYGSHLSGRAPPSNCQA